MENSGSEVRAVVAAARDWDGEVDDARIDAILSGLIGGSFDDAVVTVLARAYQRMQDANQADSDSLADAALACYDLKRILDYLGDSFSWLSTLLRCDDRLRAEGADLSALIKDTLALDESSVGPSFSEAQLAVSGRRFAACIKAAHTVVRRVEKTYVEEPWPELMP